MFLSFFIHPERSSQSDASLYRNLSVLYLRNLTINITIKTSILLYLWLEPHRSKHTARNTGRQIKAKRANNHKETIRNRKTDRYIDI